MSLIIMNGDEERNDDNDGDHDENGGDHAENGGDNAENCGDHESSGRLQDTFQPQRSRHLQ